MVRAILVRRLLGMTLRKQNGRTSFFRDRRTDAHETREIGRHGNGLMTDDLRLPAIPLLRGPACAVAACITVAMLAACDRESDQVRSYDIPKEQKPAAVASTRARPTAAPRIMGWDLPDGWQRKSGGGGMRFATLILQR